MHTHTIIDGNPSTVWHQSSDKKMPVDLVIDFGKIENLIGFKYLPNQRGRNPGIITNYQFYASTDNKDWELADQGEFSNIRNNPSWQIRKFSPVSGLYIRFRALDNSEKDDNTAYAEVDVITNE